MQPKQPESIETKRPVFEHELLEIMKQEGKNIPFTRKMIAELPLGFSPTAYFFSKNTMVSPPVSKYIQRSDYNAPRRLNANQ